MLNKEDIDVVYSAGWNDARRAMREQIVRVIRERDALADALRDSHKLLKRLWFMSETDALTNEDVKVLSRNDEALAALEEES